MKTRRANAPSAGEEEHRKRHLRGYLTIIAVLACIHTLVSVGLYHHYTIRRSIPIDSKVTEITTPAERARGEASYRMVTKRTEYVTPWFVMGYISLGFVCLGTAAIIAVLRHHEDE